MHMWRLRWAGFEAGDGPPNKASAGQGDEGSRKSVSSVQCVQCSYAGVTTGWLAARWHCWQRACVLPVKVFAERNWGTLQDSSPCRADVSVAVWHWGSGFSLRHVSFSREGNVWPFTTHLL